MYFEVQFALGWRRLGFRAACCDMGVQQPWRIDGSSAKTSRRLSFTLIGMSDPAKGDYLRDDWLEVVKKRTLFEIPVSF